MRLGIDLGTCLSCAAVLSDGEIKLVKDPIKHGYSFPSAVFVTEKNEILVGHAAENNRRKDPGRYKREFKRDWGNREPYLLGGRQFLPEDLAAEVLKKLKLEADKMLGHQGHKSVSALITVPANYASHKRKLVKKAGVAAGFDHVEILEEPVAAAIYYTYSGGVVKEGEKLLVYDLGGGTFDAALIQKKGDSFELLAPPVGLEHCGGVDFDRKIYNDLQSRCSPQLRELLDPGRRDIEALRARAVIADFCRDLKHQLSEAQEASDEILLPRVDPETYELTRLRFNGMIKSLLEETSELCHAHVREASLKWDDIVGILLVGGSCRTPYVQDIVKQNLGRPVFWVEDPELAVCKGAAVYGAALDGRAAAEHGTAIAGGVMQGAASARGAGASGLVVSAKGDGTHTTIGSAILAATPGARIMVRPGVYRESVVVDRNVEIVAEGSSDEVVVESTDKTTLAIQTATCLIRGLSFRLKTGGATQLACVDIPTGQSILEGCTFTSDSLACVSIHGEGTDPTLRQCTVRDGAQSGIFVFERARGTIEDCEVTANGYSGIDIGQGAEPIIRNSRVYANKQCGVCVFDEARGVVENCEIHHNAISGVMIRQNGNPLFRACAIHDEKAGVVVSINGAGVVQECDIRASAVAGIDIKKAGNPTILRCRIRDGQGSGVLVRDGGRGTVEECEITGNTAGDLTIQPECNPVLRNNKVGGQGAAPSFQQPAAEIPSAKHPVMSPPQGAGAPQSFPDPQFSQQQASFPPRMGDQPGAQGVVPPQGTVGVLPDFIVPEQFFLLCADHTTGRLIGPEQHIHYGVNASLLADLFLRGRLMLTPDQMVVVKTNYPVGHDAIDFVLRRISGTAGAFPVSRWIRHLDDNWGHALNSFGMVAELLGRKGVVLPRPGSPPNPSAPMPPAKQMLVQRIRETILNGRMLDEPSSVVFSLLRACGASASVLAPREIAQRADIIDAIDRRNPLGVALAKVIVLLIAEDVRNVQGGRGNW